MAKLNLKAIAMEEDAPEWFERVLKPLNDLVSQLSDGLSGRLTRRDNFLGYAEPFDFTTGAVAADTFPLRFKNKLLGGVKPVSVTVGQLQRFDRAVPANAFSLEWGMSSSGDVEVRFQGLENSTRYVGTLLFDA